MMGGNLGPLQNRRDRRAEVGDVTKVDMEFNKYGENHALYYKNTCQ